MMRAVIRTMVIRDSEGYEVRDFGPPKEGATLASWAANGVHIVGRSGKNDKSYISTAQDLRLWEKAREFNSPEDVAAFMSKWGQLSRWIGDKGEQPYSEPFLLLEQNLSGLKALAACVE